MRKSNARCALLLRSGLAAILLAAIPPLGAVPQSQSSIAQLATVVPGNVHPLARAEFDRGPAAASLLMERMTLIFRQTPQQQAALDALLAAQQNPASPEFHQWLTPPQYANRFGVTQSQMDLIVAWLRQQGFAIVETPPSRTAVVFSGTAAQVQSAFHTRIHNYVAGGRSFYANSAEPSLPPNLAGFVLGFRGLNNFPVYPRSIRKAASTQPNFTSNISGNHYLAPNDFATIYDLQTLYSAGFTGAGQKIVIVGQSNIVPADLADFRSAAGLPANPPTVMLVPGSNDPGVVDSGDEQESTIDLEWSGAVAPNASILFIYSGSGVFDAMQYAIQQNLAPVISISYGECEPNFGSAELTSLATLAQQANAQGISIVSSTGDAGATDCDGDADNFPARLGLNVDVPADLPYVTGVGGTEFDEGNGSYWSATNNSSDGSALSYIPEMAWNDSSPASCTPSATVKCGLSAGGGGVSAVFAKPSWQTGTGVPNDSFRDVPDIAANASAAHDGYLTCVQIEASGSSTYSSSCVGGNSTCPDAFRQANCDLAVYGGTSFGAPTFAGVLALINQKTGMAGQGNANFVLYALAAQSAAAFHDITVGNNNSPCSQGTTDCPDGGSIGYNAGTGYDQATGLGSIDATNLANAWDALVNGSGGESGLSASPSSQTVAAGGAADYTISDSTTTAYALTCSGLPAGASCAAVSVNGQSSATLMISTTARSSALSPSALFQPPAPHSLRQMLFAPRALFASQCFIGLFLAALAWCAVRSREVAWASFCLLLLLAAGCGSSGGGAGANTDTGGTPAGTYTITITGTSGSQTQTVTVALKVT